MQISNSVLRPTVAAAATAPKADPTGPLSLPSRSTYDAKSSSAPRGGLGELKRKDDDAASGDAAIDAAHDNAAKVADFYATVLNRDSIDGKHMAMVSVVHYGRAYNNAYWDGSKMTYGDGDGKMFIPLSQGLDVVGHEMTHGVTEHSAGLAYRGQSGALNESWSDVFGELIEQWSENKAGFGTTDAAKGADWLIGEDVFTPGVEGDALRSLKAPGTAYPQDPQPADMAHYKNMSGDNGGVHYNSGIPNKAAYEVAVRLGSDKLAHIWYDALTDGLQSTSQFNDAARVTIAAAAKLYGDEGSQAVTDAWAAVGVQPGTSTAAERRQSEGPVDGADEGIVPKWLLDGSIKVQTAA